MNKKGFTLIEILAVIVIIGIISTIGIVSISSNINKSRDASVVDLAKVYAEAARMMRARDDFYYDPKNKEAIIIPYSQVTGVEIENKDVTGYGDIIPTYCYVGVVNDNSNYKYYVTQVDNSYHFLNGVEYNSIKEEDVNVGSEQLASNGVKEIKAPLTGFNISYGSKTYNIKGARVKLSATGGGKNVTLYGYFTSDNSYTMASAHIKGNLSAFDTFKSTGKFPGSNSDGTYRYNNVNYTITNSEIMYIIATSN